MAAWPGVALRSNVRCAVTLKRAPASAGSAGEVQRACQRLAGVVLG